MNRERERESCIDCTPASNVRHLVVVNATDDVCSLDYQTQYEDELFGVPVTESLGHNQQTDFKTYLRIPKAALAFGEAGPSLV